jgi:hypothetical protein
VADKPSEQAWTPGGRAVASFRPLAISPMAHASVRSLGRVAPGATRPGDATAVAQRHVTPREEAGRRPKANRVSLQLRILVRREPIISVACPAASLSRSQPRAPRCPHPLSPCRAPAPAAREGMMRAGGHESRRGRRRRDRRGGFASRLRCQASPDHRICCLRQVLVGARAAGFSEL